MTDGGSEYFERIAGRVNLDVLARQLVVVVGVGTVGSQVARELANSGVGRLRLIDGDRMETPNLARHLLPQEYIGINKAEGVASFLLQIPNLFVETVSSYVDERMPDRDLDALLRDADLIVAATDDREAQRRIGRRALSNDILAVFPGIYGDNGGEVVIQTDASHPCFMCWDGFRPADAELRGVTALNKDALPIIELTVHVCLGLLDPGSDFQQLLAERSSGGPLPQLFIQRRFAPVDPKFILRRPDCPSCAVGPAAGESQPTPAPSVASIPPSPPVPGTGDIGTAGASGADDDGQDVGAIVLGVALGLVLGIGGCARYGATHEPGSNFSEVAALGIGFGPLLLCVLIGVVIQVVLNHRTPRR